MGGQVVVGHQLSGDLRRQPRVEAAPDIDACRFRRLVGWISLQLLRLAAQVRLLGVALRADRDVFASRHRHGARKQAGSAGHQDRGARPWAEDGEETPFPIAVTKPSSHCGAGCALGDLIAEWAAFLVPAVAMAFGWKSVFAEKTFAVWILDFLLAYGLGIVFQYYTIKPMRDLSPGKAIVQALKADTASITSWQVGMYGFMAVAQFAWFRPAYGGLAPVDTPEFWFVMQLAMLCGFATSYPVNWALLKMGVKERM